ncbi:FAD-dependent oxidoreductase [Myxococcota bacterium]
MTSKFRDPRERKASLADAFGSLRLQWAVAEASRCLMCDDPPCRKGCLADVDIKKFIRALKSRNMRSALAAIRDANFLVATCGRVCPQAELCEGKCSSTDLARPIAIGELQRFVGETALAKGMKPSFPEVKSKGRVAVVGGGPAGLSAGFYLRNRGVQVDLYERRDFLGGVMMYGIPGYRLPKDLLNAEIAQVGDGASVIHQEVSDFADLTRRYEAIVLGCGLGAPRNLDIQGADLPGVWQADDLLLNVNVRGDRPDLSGTTVILGGGNTAMDAAGVSLRLGSERVIIAYRRTEPEMPSWLADRQFVAQEGVELRFLLAPDELMGASGRLDAIRFQKTELGEPDESGRRRPVPVAGAFEEIACRQVILALGNRDNDCWKQLDLDEEGDRVKVDPETMETSKPGVYLAGDLLSGGGTVVQAVVDGRRAAHAIASRVLAQ